MKEFWREKETKWDWTPVAELTSWVKWTDLDDLMESINTYATENELDIVNIEGLSKYLDGGQWHRCTDRDGTQLSLAGYRVYYKKM
ncbi:Hypothetical protein POVR2_LOCUS64 [uncultured virus]|nr:Hypothetical protein POVR2_LOCUS64 [uncultured virus]